MASTAELPATDTLVTRSGGPWGDAARALRHDGGALVGFAIVGALILVAIAAPLIAPFDPREQGLGGRLVAAPPSWQHPFGLDGLARDQLSRVCFGARYSLVIGIVAVGVGLLAGSILGGIAGYVRGVVDTILMRLVDIMLAIPGLLMAIGIVALLGPGLVQIMIAVGVTQIPMFARLLRSSVLAQRHAEYVVAAESVGITRRSTLLAHIVPNAIAPVIVQGTLALATAIIDVAGLGFLGLGPQDPATPEWGTMLVGSNRFLQTAPYLALIPGAAIAISVLGFNLVGDALREALDPKLRGRL